MVGVEVSISGSTRIDQKRRASNPCIYVFGDVVGGSLLAHKAPLIESILVAERIMDRPVCRLDYKTVPTTIFPSLEVSSIGYTEEELRKGKKI